MYILDLLDHTLFILKQVTRDLTKIIDLLPAKHMAFQSETWGALCVNIDTPFYLVHSNSYVHREISQKN